MDALECIATRRSVRSYTDQPISRETFKRLLELGVAAATGSNGQPWGFVIIQNAAELKALSQTVKKSVLARMDETPYLKQYEGWLGKEDTCVFNNAPALLIIYGDTASFWHVYDGTLAAANIMLAAHDMGIGTCWIGFAQHFLNTSEFKKRYNIPEHFELVCPLGMGYEKGTQTPPKRKAPVVFHWS